MSITIVNDVGAKRRLNPGDLIPEILGLIQTQQYEGKPRIHGVEILDLPVATDTGGAFMEIARLDSGAQLKSLADRPFQIRQANYSEMEPGALKAWHLHFNQEDVWFVPPRDRLLAGLWDLRRDSPTVGLRMRFVLGAGRARLLYIPRGVAHGAANLTGERCQIWYFVNQAFDPQAPDERRLPWDAAGADFWEMERG